MSLRIDMKTLALKGVLFTSNVILLCVGLTVLILGVKMNIAVTLLTLNSIPFVQNAVNAIIAAGVFISLCSISGLVGTCNGSKWLILTHLIFLGMIVILQMSVGITVMMMHRTVSLAVESPDCDYGCSAKFDKALLNYALPSVGLMMFVIFVQAVMIGSSMRLYFIIKDRERENQAPELPVIGDNIQMQNVAQPGFRTQTLPTQALNASSSGYTAVQSPPAYQDVGTVRRSHIDLEDEPPDYNSLSRLLPPLYNSLIHDRSAGTSTTEIPEEADHFNQV